MVFFLQRGKIFFSDWGHCRRNSTKRNNLLPLAFSYYFHLVPSSPVLSGTRVGSRKKFPLWQFAIAVFRALIWLLGLTSCAILCRVLCAIWIFLSGAGRREMDWGRESGREEINVSFGAFFLGTNIPQEIGLGYMLECPLLGEVYQVKIWRLMDC